MGVEISGLSEVMTNIKRTAERTSANQLKELTRSAEEVRDLARDYAPVDEGNLEQAIVAQKTREGTFNGRIEYLVGVDPSKLGEGYTRYGYRYDIHHHEGYSPGLGEKSLQKSKDLGVLVGPKYLERAYTELESKILKRMQRVLDKEFS